MSPEIIQQNFFIFFPIRKHKNKWIPEFTRYWIKRETRLYKEISRLEAQGTIKKLEAEIKNNIKLQQKLKQLHRKEIEIRIKLLDKFPDNEPFGTLKQILKQENIGLGGIRDWQQKHTLKCLHLWTAYHLLEPQNFSNFIGEYVLGIIDL